MKVEERKMKNSEHFGELTSRMNHFREEVLDKKTAGALPAAFL